MEILGDSGFICHFVCIFLCVHRMAFFRNKTVLHVGSKLKKVFIHLNGNAPANCSGSSHSYFYRLGFKQILGEHILSKGTDGIRTNHPCDCTVNNLFFID